MPSEEVGDAGTSKEPWREETPCRSLGRALSLVECAGGAFAAKVCSENGDWLQFRCLKLVPVPIFKIGACPDFHKTIGANGCMVELATADITEAMRFSMEFKDDARLSFAMPDVWRRLDFGPRVEYDNNTLQIQKPSIAQLLEMIKGSKI